ncbi:hypothetical protein B2I23_05450 [Candidatus Liberibacter asiaticus]|nr:hypothetical protein B2I23_05450 [Candidatus Liberibacter asiaticus]
MPPTKFFDTLCDEGIKTAKSILDACKPLFQPIRRLRWHYRSWHRSFISFSHHPFYDNNFIIFPSPIAHSDFNGCEAYLRR